MAGKLNARKLETLTKPGRYADGGNLYLRISPNGGKRWMFFYRFGGKRRDLGLGSAAKGGVSLAEARQKTDAAGAILRSGTDPILVMGKDAREKADRNIPTFGQFADEYIAAHRPKFRNEKHAAQWERRRQAVDAVREKYNLSERSACRIVGQPRGTQRYVPTLKPDEDELTRTIVYLASEYGRYGYRRVTALLNDSGMVVGKDRRASSSAAGSRPAWSSSRPSSTRPYASYHRTTTANTRPTPN